MNVPFQLRYLLYLLGLHAVLVALVYWLFREQKVWFFVAEVGMLLSLGVGIWLFRQFRQPSEFIAAGIEAIRDQDFTIKFVPTGTREVDELIRVYNLMIDQLRLERTRQREQQFFLENLIDATPIAILILDFDERIARLNPKAERLLGQRAESVAGKLIPELDHPLLTQLKGLVSGETRTIRSNGGETYRVLRSHFMDRGFARAFLLIEELTREILETEKAAYGKVIRMMAHEVNNSVGAVNSILDVAQGYLEAPDVRHALRVAHERNERLGGFMRRFADVVRLPVPNPQRTDLAGIVRNVVELMQPQAEARGVVLTLETVPVERSFDVAQLEQVLVNILKNALEACAPEQRVDVVLEAETLTIRDNGYPIPDEVAVNLFNPFFSTKPTGQGIGLTLTREILHNHGWTFSLRTHPDGWTRFVIRW
jgi:two-component system nitrogen regulation sensor histidine kinase NtrY